LNFPSDENIGIKVYNNVHHLIYQLNLAQNDLELDVPKPMLIKVNIPYGNYTSLRSTSFMIFISVKHRQDFVDLWIRSMFLSRKDYMEYKTVIEESGNPDIHQKPRAIAEPLLVSHEVCLELFSLMYS
jgi:hypothetical protein